MQVCVCVFMFRKKHTGIPLAPAGPEGPEGPCAPCERKTKAGGDVTASPFINDALYLTEINNLLPRKDTASLF